MRCEFCRKQFTDPKHPGRKFCSQRCAGLAIAEKRGQEHSVEGACDRCGKLFLAMPSAERQFCSVECARLAAFKDRPKCKMCGKPVQLMRNRYCSRACRAKDTPKRGITTVSGFYLRA